MNRVNQPTPAEIRAARMMAQLTQTQAARLVHLHGTPQRWSEYERGVRPICIARWELFLLLTRQHPSLAVVSVAARRTKKTA